MSANPQLSGASDFVANLVRSALGRRLEAPGAPPEAAEAVPEAPQPASAQHDAEPGGFDPDIVGVLSEKVLLAWLRNRHQLLFPVAVDLHRLDRAQAELFLHAMLAAAEADGSLEGSERERIEGALSLVHLKDEERRLLDSALATPQPLNAVLRAVRDVQTAALVYAASLMAVDQRKPVNRLYLRYLAARLQLSEELVGSLEQRFRSSG